MRGITGWLRVAAESARSCVPICSLGMQELHVSLVSRQADGGWLEVHSFQIDRYTKQPLQLEKHLAVVPDAPGIKAEFDWERLKPFRLQLA